MVFVFARKHKNSKTWYTDGRYRLLGGLTEAITTLYHSVGTFGNLLKIILNLKRALDKSVKMGKIEKLGR